MIQSVERAAAILEIIAQEGGRAHLRTIHERMGIGKTTVHNILKTLDRLGYVQRVPGDMRYRLGSRILNIARMAGNDAMLRDRVRPVLEAVARACDATVLLAVPSGDEVTYLDMIEAPAWSLHGVGFGQREKLEGSALGLVFLAFFPGVEKRMAFARHRPLSAAFVSRIEQVRAKGYALDLEACRPGWNCVAVPWRDGGLMQAGISVTGPADRLPRRRLIDLSWTLMTLAA
ncbi:putative transcriptional regulator [Gluconacetobacter sacchari DSM 12717]|uniref:IclR family transcriptional regulator n=2 Tax=Gluconacetobacter sacchari TaxID=92759 RepID=A0A7W4IEK5_9PROT|nr:IclR family transcriptional regulator [Gluconacetobacter sacchari]MBB2161329.1 IclR family transcriptional regulator [Gluconacetobacter sacchari]GBQ29836.1 putative transcriptional regulator [Gluconacetobacter sacchari DSM 12717]